MSWRADAACRGLDPNLWFPGRWEGPADFKTAAEARAICHQCPVRQECADYAVETNQEFGIWGGVSRRTRKQIIREQGAA